MLHPEPTAGIVAAGTGSNRTPAIGRVRVPRATVVRQLSRLGRMVAVALTVAAGAVRASAQQPVVPDPLASLVAEGVRQNLALSRQRLAVARADAGLRQTRGAFLPSVGLEARYTEARGNLVDIGAFVNPANRALNQLTGSSAFPTDIEARLPLTQETRLRLVQPLFQPALVAGYRLSRTEQRLQHAALAVATRRLAADIRLAYLDHARAVQLAALYETTLPLVAENRRVNERLVSNGQATPDGVARARAEQSEVEQQLAAAEERRSAARRVLNYLLNRELATPVELVPDALLETGELLALDDALRAGLRGREEMQQTALGIEAAGGQRHLARAAYLPAVAAALDYGVQGADYAFNGDRDFALATVTLQWNLFNGGQDRAREQQAAIEGARARVQQTDVERQIALDIETAHEQALVARRAIATATDRLTSAERSFRLVDRRYAEGLASLVEFIDARTSYTSAGLNRVLTTYDYLARRVELDRAAALTPLPPFPSDAR